MKNYTEAERCNPPLRPWARKGLEGLRSKPAGRNPRKARSSPYVSNDDSML